MLNKSVGADQEYLVELQMQGVNGAVVKENLLLLGTRVAERGCGDNKEFQKIWQSLIGKITAQLFVLEEQVESSSQHEEFSYETERFTL